MVMYCVGFMFMLEEVSSGRKVGVLVIFNFVVVGFEVGVNKFVVGGRVVS